MRTFITKQRWIIILWILIVPPGLFLIQKMFPSPEINPIYIALFAVFGFFTTFFPIYQNGKPLFIVMWVTVPVFLMYGLFMEMIIMQIALIGGLFGFSNDQSKLYRFFINSLLFFGLSIISASMFWWVGGEIGSQRFWQVVSSVFMYQLTHSVCNDLFLRLFRRLHRTSAPYIVSPFIKYSTMIVVLPLTLSFYFLVSVVGIGAFLLIGIPFVIITFVMRLYNRSEEVNALLKTAGEIGQHLSEIRSENELINQFILQIHHLFDASHVYLFDYQDGWLELIRSYEMGSFQSIPFDRLQPGDGLAGHAMKERKPLIYHSRKEWLAYSKNYTPETVESFLCVPIIRNRKVEAVILLGSEKKHAFRSDQLMILDLLGSHFTISIEKTRYLEELVKRSERCALTQLYNYRYLEEKLAAEMEKLRNGRLSSLSVLLLDIDYFKLINDQYGHDNGNLILKQLANLLQQQLPMHATVGRYGGEEFVFILPEMPKEQANLFAEQLRRKISENNFIVKSDLQDDDKKTQIQLTVSIGLATAPDDGDESMAMLRNADRALYLGAKQSGRNRVAQYVK